MFGHTVLYIACIPPLAARIVGITTSGLARTQSLIQAIRPRICIVEEAAEVFEAHVLTSLCKVGKREC